MTLSRFPALFDALGDQADACVPVFVTVDPERDTLPRLSSYLSGFDPRIKGIRLIGDDLAQVLRNWQIKVVKNSAKRPGGYYSLDHTGDLFFVGPDGLITLTHPHDALVDPMLSDVNKLLESQ